MQINMDRVLTVERRKDFIAVTIENGVGDPIDVILNSDGTICVRSNFDIFDRGVLSTLTSLMLEHEKACKNADKA